MDDRLAAFDAEWKTGDRDKAREMAKEFVAASTDALEELLVPAVRALREARLDDPPTREDLVGLVTAYRNAGDEESRLIADMYLLAGWEPQNIVGNLRVMPALRKRG